MCKDRTSIQDFNLIKGLIESKTKLDIIKIIRKENITIWRFFAYYRKFILTNYLSEKLPKDSRRKASLYLVKKQVYKSECGARSSKRTLSDKGLDKTSKSFRKSTYRIAIDQMSELKKEVDLVDGIINSYCGNNDTYSDGFISLCEKYNLIAYVERNKKRNFYKITAPEITKEQIIRDERMKVEKKRIQEKQNKEHSLLLLKDKKAKIKLLKEIYKSHYKGRIYTQENIIKLEKMGCLKLNGYNEFDNNKIINKIQELQNSIQ